MRIGIDARSLTEPYPSGITVYAYHVIKHLVAVAPQHQFVLFSSGTSGKHAPLIQQLFHAPHVTHVHLPWPNKVFHGLGAFGLAPLIDTTLGAVDVLFAPNIHVMPVSKTVPLVVTVHDMSYALHKNFLSYRRKIWHAMVRPARLLRRANKVITVSHATRHDVVREYHLAPEAVIAIHSAVPEPLPELLSRPETSSSTELNVPDRYAVVVSTIEPRKNILGVIQAFQLYRKHVSHNQAGRDMQLVVVGARGWKSSAVLGAMQADPTIHYIGYASSEQKQAIIRGARYLIYPSMYEGFGFPPLEALAQNVPVLTSRVGALPEVLGEAALYIDPYSIQDMATAMHALDTDEELRSELLNNRLSVLNRYSWDATAQQTLKVLQEAI